MVSRLRRSRRGECPRIRWNMVAEKSLLLIDKNKFLASFFDINRVTEFIKRSKDAREFYQVLTLILYLIEIHNKFGDKMNIPDNS